MLGFFHHRSDVQQRLGDPVAAGAAVHPEVLQVGALAGRRRRDQVDETEPAVGCARHDWPGTGLPATKLTWLSDQSR